MPIIESQYRSPFGFKNPHLQTLFPYLIRKVPRVDYERERVDTPDGDFLDIDWVRNGHPRLALISHGLEGSSRSTYVRGMARALARYGWDVAAWSFRGCSGEPNRKLYSYHSGKSEDLRCVLEHLLEKTDYQEIALVGFSVGGNITLKYLGECGEKISPRLRSAVTLSVPCDLRGSAAEMAKPHNSLYMKRFLILLRQTVREKIKLFPGEIDDKDWNSIRTFEAFDDRYTAPMNGFADAREYWQKSSSLAWIPRIRIPTLIISAQDDSFLSPSCFPREQSASHPHVLLEIPRTGGHVGFVTFFSDGLYWSELRTAQFLEAPEI